LPWETAKPREFGRHTITTGIPGESRPVTFATRVMPSKGNSPRSAPTVSSGLDKR